MFFILSKLTAFLITPLVWIIALLFVAVFSNEQKRKQKVLWWALGLTLFFSNSFIFDECIRLWEVPPKHSADLKTYNAGIVLGGMISYDQEYDRLQFYRGADRLFQALELYKRGAIKKIIFTAGSGSLTHPEIKEGSLVRRYLRMLGIPEADLLIEQESRNTRENAVFTKALLAPENLKSDFLLITSAIHMRRSLGCFEKVGIKAEPYSTDRYARPRESSLYLLIVPNLSAMNDWSFLLHEVIGLVTYKIMGYV